MKKLIALLAIAIAIVAFAPAKAEAGGYKKHHSTCGVCHAPVYSYYTTIGYDNCGHPIYGWVVKKHTGCSHHSGHGGGHSSHGSGGHGGHSGGVISIHKGGFSFGFKVPGHGGHCK